MSAIELSEHLIKEGQASKEIDWRKAREQIIDEHRRAITTAERVACLSLHKAIMDAVERNNIPLENMELFRKTRMQDYRALLISEAIIGRTDGMVPPDKMAEITTREVREGRLSADDELHVLAVNAINGIFPELEKGKSRGLFAAVRSWLGR